MGDYDAPVPYAQDPPVTHCDVEFLNFVTPGATRRAVDWSCVAQLSSGADVHQHQ